MTKPVKKKKKLNLSAVKFHLHAICEHAASSKTHAINILTKKIEQLESGQKSNIGLIEKLRGEQAVIEGFSPYEVGIYALKHLDDTATSIENRENHVRMRSFARVIRHPEIKKIVTTFRDRYPQWSECLENLLLILEKNESKFMVSSKANELNRKPAGAPSISPETVECESESARCGVSDSELDYDLDGLDDVDLEVDLDDSNSDSSSSPPSPSSESISKPVSTTNSKRPRQTTPNSELPDQSKKQKTKKQPRTSNDTSVDVDLGSDRVAPTDRFKTEVKSTETQCHLPISSCAVVKPIDLNTECETLDIAQPCIRPLTNGSAVTGTKLGRISQRSSFFVGGRDEVAKEATSSCEEDGEDVLMHGRRRLVHRQQRNASARGASCRKHEEWKGAEVNGKFFGRNTLSGMKMPSKDLSGSGSSGSSSLLRPSYLKNGHAIKNSGSKPRQNQFNRTPSSSERRNLKNGNFSQRFSDNKQKSSDLHPSWEAKRNQKPIDFNQRGMKTVFNFD